MQNTEPSEQEMLVAACRKLGWKVIVSESTILKIRKTEFFRPDGTLSQEPRFTSSLDAHFAPGGTVEWMRKEGWKISLHEKLETLWACQFAKKNENSPTLKTIIEHGKTPAMAILKAFLKHES